MKILKILLLVILTILIFRNSFSRQESITKKLYFRKDTLTVGNYYTFYIKFSNPSNGKLLAIEENNFIIYIAG
jgi:hypothetical protein